MYLTNQEKNDSGQHEISSNHSETSVPFAQEEESLQEEIGENSISSILSYIDEASERQHYKSSSSSSSDSSSNSSTSKNSFQSYGFSSDESSGDSNYHNIREQVRHQKRKDRKSKNQKHNKESQIKEILKDSNDKMYLTNHEKNDSSQHEISSNHSETSVPFAQEEESLQEEIEIGRAHV